MSKLILGFELRNYGEKDFKRQMCGGNEMGKCCLKAHAVNDITTLFILKFLIFSCYNENSFSLLCFQIVSISVG